MDLLAFVRLLGRNWLILLLILLAGSASTWFFTSLQPSIYTAQTTLVVSPNPATLKDEQIIGSLNTLDRRSIVATVAKIPPSATIRGRAWGQLNPSGHNIADYPVRTAVLPDTNILQIAVEGPDPSLTATFANAIAQVSSRSMSEYYDMYQLTLLDPATTPSERARPSLKRNMSVGILLSLLLGVLLILLAEYWRHLRRTATDAKKPQEPTA